MRGDVDPADIGVQRWGTEVEAKAVFKVKPQLKVLSNAGGQGGPARNTPTKQEHAWAEF
jgi:hypothetical protein